MTRSKNSRGIKTMNIGQKQIAGVMARAKRMGRPRIGSWRCSVTVPFALENAVNEHRRLTEMTKEQALIDLAEIGYGKTQGTRTVDTDAALACLRGVLAMKLKVTNDKERKLAILRAQMALDGIAECLGTEGGAE
jgi:hypothetical protein